MKLLMESLVEFTYLGRGNLFSGTEGALLNTAIDKILDLGTNESRPFARLHMEKFKHSDRYTI
jgi:hypothetical protein